MTLDKHRIDGLPKILDRTMVSSRYEQLLIDAGYSKVGTAPAKGDRVKAWWIHPSYRRVEVIYTADQSLVVSAYHVN